MTRGDLAEVASELDADLAPGAAEAWHARYNVAPSQPHPIVVLDYGRRRLELAAWGFGGGAAPGGKRLINARAETVASKPWSASASGWRWAGRGATTPRICSVAPTGLC